VQVVPGPTGEPIQTWHIDQDGSIDIFLYNDPIPHQFKDILLQITSDKAPAYPPGPTVDSPLGPGGPGTPGLVAAWGPSAGGDYWYTYTYSWTIQPNPPYEFIHIPVVYSTNIDEIVIDTISYDVPEPGMIGVLMTVAVMLRRRR
jgi:hypothetical protein